MPKQHPPVLTLSSPDVASFVADAPAVPPKARAESKPGVPKRGEVLQASGRIVRRLVVHVETDLGDQLDTLSEETGASLSRITGDAIRRGLEKR